MLFDLSRFQNFITRVRQGTNLPLNQNGSLLVGAAGGLFDALQSAMPVAWVENDTELTQMQNNSENFANVFNSWRRISRSGVNSSDNAIPAELNAWSYDAVNDRIRNTTNSSSVIGFVSPERFDNFVFEAQLTSTDGDNDFIGLIIAYAKDASTGLTHILTATRGLNGSAPFMIDKNFNGFDTRELVISNQLGVLKWGDGTVATAAGAASLPGWSGFPTGTKVKVTREGDIITCETTQINETTYVDAAKIVFDLSANPALSVFRGPQSYGYMSMSQANSSWATLQKPGGKPTIVDIRDFSIWTWQNNAYVKSTSSVADLVANRVLVQNWLHLNTVTGKAFVLSYDNTLWKI